MIFKNTYIFKTQTHNFTKKKKFTKKKMMVKFLKKEKKKRSIKNTSMVHVIILS